jgi:hypothetical protein
MEKIQTGEKVTIEKLKIQLEEAGIDVTSWGTGKAKTLDNLLAEVKGGETVLETSDDGELLRVVVVGGADLYYG